MKHLVYAFLLDVARAYDQESVGAAARYAKAQRKEVFLSESLAVLRALETNTVPANDLMKTLAHLLVEEAGPFMEDGDVHHFSSAHQETAQVIARLRSEQTPHAVTGMFQRLLARVYPGSSLTVIQTPRRLETAARVQMRRTLAQSAPDAYPTFAVDRSLLGGMRLFINGALVDNSWQQKIASMLQTLS